MTDPFKTFADQAARAAHAEGLRGQKASPLDDAVEITPEWVQVRDELGPEAARVAAATAIPGISATQDSEHRLLRALDGAREQTATMGYIAAGAVLMSTLAAGFALAALSAARRAASASEEVAETLRGFRVETQEGADAEYRH